MSKRSRQKSQPPSLFRKFWREDYTKVLASAQALGAAVTASLTSLNSVLHTTQFKDILDTVHTPWYVPTGIAVLAFITYLAAPHDA